MIVAFETRILRDEPILCRNIVGIKEQCTIHSAEDPKESCAN
jgi:hypothetical protein